MSYDESIAQRVRGAIGARAGVTEKRMFGGISFLLDGKMFCGVINDDLMVRVGPQRHASALARPHVRPMDFTGKPLVGYVFVAPGGARTGPALAEWVTWAVDFVAELPAKKPRASKRSGDEAKTASPAQKSPPPKKATQKKPPHRTS